MTLVMCHDCDVGFPPDEIDGHRERMHGEVRKVGFQKHGTGEILPEPGDDKKTASANWTEKDEQALVQENATADQQKED